MSKPSTTFSMKELPKEYREALKILGKMGISIYDKNEKCYYPLDIDFGNSFTDFRQTPTKSLTPLIVALLNGPILKLNLNKVMFDNVDGIHDPSCWAKIAKALGANTTIEYLNLSDHVDIPPEGIDALAVAIRENKSLRTLEFYFTDMTDAQVLQIAKAASTSSIETLVLTRFSLYAQKPGTYNSDFVRELKEIFDKSPQLKKLDYGWNPNAPIGTRRAFGFEKQPSADIKPGGAAAAGASPQASGRS